MNSRTAIVLALLVLTGCVTLTPYSYVSYTVGTLDSCTTGSSMIRVQQGWKSTLQQGEFFGSEEELVFTGISANTLHLTYREYTTNTSGVYIKPAFSLNLQYDLNASRVIAFRNYLIEIPIATPLILKYRILQAGTQPNAPVRRVPVGKSKTSADVVYLRTGTFVIGQIIAEVGEGDLLERVTIRDANGEIHTYTAPEIKSIEKVH